MAAARKIAVSFTGGKDSTLVLHLLRDPSLLPHDSEVTQRRQQLGPCEVVALVTFVPVGGSSFKAHPLEVVRLQAQALGLPHHVLEVRAPFLESYRDNIASLRTRLGVDGLATGDILDVCSSFMPRAAAGTGVELLTPLWGLERTELLRLVWAYGLRPLVTCVNTAKFTEAGGQEGQAAEREAGAAVPVCGRQPGTTAAGGGEAGAAGGAAAGPGSGPACGAGSGAAAPLGPPGLLGGVLDAALLRDVLLPAKARYGVDECGEWGELHTMCVDGAQFAAPLLLSTAPKSEGDFAFLAVSSASLGPPKQ